MNKSSTGTSFRYFRNLLSLLFIIGISSLVSKAAVPGSASYLLNPSDLNDEKLSDAPMISSFSPSSGAIGTLVTIQGTGLSDLTGFTIGGVSAITVSNTGTTLVGMVMPGAVTGGISATSAGGSATSSTNFTVTPTLIPSAQQGAKLTGTGGKGYLGYSVSVSADRNTAIAGAVLDNSQIGAAFIFLRSNGIWSQQGPKLVGSSAEGSSQQGFSVSISADGNTAAVGGNQDERLHYDCQEYVDKGL